MPNRKWATYRAKVTAKNRQLRDETKNRPCADCGVKYPIHVMYFDHVRGEKMFDIGQGNSRAPSKVEAEIAKCDGVCANCHRMRTWAALNV